MPATDQHLRAIAFLAKDCRPRGCKPWDEKGIFDNAARIRHWHLRELTIEVLSAAADPSADTPGVIGKPGPHRHLDASPPADRVPANAHCSGCGQAKAVCESRRAAQRGMDPDDPRYDDHTYTPVARASANKRDPEVCADIREALAAEKTPMREPSHEGGRVTAGAGRARVGAARTDRDDLINPTTEEHQ